LLSTLPKAATGLAAGSTVEEGGEGGHRRGELYAGSSAKRDRAWPWAASQSALHVAARTRVDCGRGCERGDAGDRSLLDDFACPSGRRSGIARRDHRPVASSLVVICEIGVFSPDAPALAFHSSGLHAPIGSRRVRRWPRMFQGYDLPGE